MLLFLGLPPAAEAEGRDRTSIELPANQVNLLRAVSAVNPRVVVTLSTGSPVTTADWRSAASSGLPGKPTATRSPMCSSAT